MSSVRKRLTAALGAAWDKVRNDLPVRPAVAASLAAVAILAATSAAAIHASGPSSSASPDAEGAIAQAPDEPESDATPDASSIVRELRFAGEDVSVSEGTSIDIESSNGEVWVAERTADGGASVELAARRCAALASALADAGDTTRVTWSIMRDDGTVAFTVSFACGDAARGLAASGEPATLDTLLEASEGWAIDDATYEATGGDSSGIAQAGGREPVGPDKEPLVAPSASGSTEVEGAESSGVDDAEPEATGSAGTPSKGSESGATSGSQGSTASSGSQPTTSSPGHAHSWEPVYSQRWVQDSAAWDETVVVSAAWDEPVYQSVDKIGCTSCGALFNSIEEWGEHSTSAHNDEASYSSVTQRVQVDTIHHDAVTEVVHHEATGHNESFVSGYRCSCGATK